MPKPKKKARAAAVVSAKSAPPEERRAFSDVTIAKINNCLEIIMGGVPCCDAYAASGIHHKTMWEWCHASPDNMARYNQARMGLIQKIESSGMKAALGYEFDEVTTERNVIQIDRDPTTGEEKPVLGPGSKIRRTRKHYAPNPALIAFFLTNNTEQYKNKMTIDGQNIVRHTIDYGKYTTDELRHMIELTEKGTVTTTD